MWAFSPFQREFRAIRWVLLLVFFRQFSQRRSGRQPILLDDIWFTILQSTGHTFALAVHDGTFALLHSANGVPIDNNILSTGDVLGMQCPISTGSVT